MFYIDTSVLIALLVGEASADRVDEWMRRKDGTRWHISSWTVTEFSSALSVKSRAENIPPSLRDLALRGFRRMAQTSLRVTAVRQRHFHAAANYCNHHTLNLRSGDALHLAIALEIGAEIITLDRRFAAATTALGGGCTLL